MGLDPPSAGAYFPNAKMYYSYDTCGNENWFAKHQQAANKTAPELISVVEAYSTDLQQEAQYTYELTTEEESVTDCDHWHSSCPCKTCSANPEWSAQATSGDISLDFTKTTLTLSDQLDTGSMAVKRIQCMTQVIASPTYKQLQTGVREKEKVETKSESATKS
jgi:hypothetical protein